MNGVGELFAFIKFIVLALLLLPMLPDEPFGPDNLLNLRDMGWIEAADLVIKGIASAIEAKTVTYDFERLMPDATLLSCSEFGSAIIQHMDD